jgi:hypothetical protein
MKEYRNDKGQLHRLDGPAFIWSDGSQWWWVDGKCHRTDGPAIVMADGDQEWWVDGKPHRLDGPARIWADGRQAWWVDGRLVKNQEQFKKLSGCSDEFLMILKLRYGPIN